jgi:uncharacterized protein (TIGR03437 family)
LKKFLAAVLLVASARAQNVLTANYDNERTNANLAETTLTPSVVKAGSFGKLFSLAVDGQVYAQPLYLQSVSIAGKGTHNVVFVATMHNTVYAFDADSPGVPLWSVNLGPSVPAANYLSEEGPYTDIQPENGILGTPVIDPSTSTLYAVAATFENGKYFYRLHALDAGSGAERFGAPAVIRASITGVGDASANGSIVFDAQQHIQRPGLLIANGQVYVAFGSHGDAAPYHGWILAYSAQNVQNQTAAFTPTPNGAAGAFWQSGRGIAADENGRIFAVSSNGDTDGQTNFSDSVLRLDPSSLSAQDWFAPADFQLLSDSDDDLGGCGAVLIDGVNEVITGTKSGMVYLLNRDTLGHTTAGDTGAVQSLDTGYWGLFNLAVWNRPDGALIYTHAANRTVDAWKLTGGRMSSQPVASSLVGFNIPSQGMAISANGVVPGTGILWVTSSAWPLPAPAVLRAYNADDMSELWNSSLSAADSLGSFVKFANPTVANGKVYVPAVNELVVYGPSDVSVQSSNPVVTSVVNAASYAGGALAPGEIVSILGQNLGPHILVTGSFSSASNTLDSQVSDTQVTFNGVPGPLIYTSDAAVAAIVPYEVAGASQVTVQLSYSGIPGSAVTLPLANVAPGVFTSDASGSGPGAILNADYSLNSPQNPAQAGGIVIVYGTGGGVTNPGAHTGALTTEAQTVASDVQVTVGGQPAQVLYAGNAGGEVAGVLQLNLRLPDGVTGTVPIAVSAEGASSPATVTVSIQ